MNALAQIGTLVGPGFPLGMPVPMGKASALANQTAFNDMFGLVLDPNQGTTTVPNATLASPSQIADAMIRSMLGTSATTASFDSSSASVRPDVANAAAALVRNQNTPNQPSPPAAPKSARGIADLVAATTMVVTTMIVPTLTVPFAAPAQLPAAAAVPNSKVDLPNENTSSSSAPALPSTSVPKPLPDAKVAFTAVLTPLNPPAANVAAPVAVSTEQLPAAAIPQQPSEVPSNNDQTRNSSAPAIPAQAAPSSLPVAGEKAAGDTPSQQHGDSPKDPQAEPTITDSKSKAVTKRTDVEIAAPATIREVAASSVTATIASAPLVRAAAASSDAQPLPPPSTADALRTSESNLTSAPPLRTGPAQEISIRIAPPDAPAVDLRVSERFGQVHVDVRTSDSAMQTSLRQDLGSLTNSLQRAGYHAETFTPSTVSRTASSAQAGNQDRQESSQNRNGAGEFSGDRRQQQQKRSGKWLEELEEQA